MLNIDLPSRYQHGFVVPGAKLTATEINFNYLYHLTCKRTGMQELKLLQGKPLLSTSQAHKTLGVSWYTFNAIAESNNIEPVLAGDRKLWRTADIEKLIGARA
jgi:hypothetical protein